MYASQYQHLSLSKLITMAQDEIKSLLINATRHLDHARSLFVDIIADINKFENSVPGHLYHEQFMPFSNNAQPSSVMSREDTMPLAEAPLSSPCPSPPPCFCDDESANPEPASTIVPPEQRAMHLEQKYQRRRNIGQKSKSVPSSQYYQQLHKPPHKALPRRI